MIPNLRALAAKAEAMPLSDLGLPMLPPRPRKWRLGLRDLLPTGWDLREAAYASLAGDMTSRPMGKHQGRRHDRRDTQGLSKRLLLRWAISRDLAPFEMAAIKVESAPFGLAPSLRTKIPKAEGHHEKGTRSIDDVAEVKRLILLHVRGIIEPRVEAVLTRGQLGGRSKNFTRPICTRPGATPQDHVATGILMAIRAGLRWAVLIDLKDAFGLVPKEAAMAGLMKLGLDRDAALWVWRLARIDALDSRTRKHHSTRPGRGIEQGNQLSAMLMNLVLAPVHRAVERLPGVQAFSYLDDIYLMCPSEAVAGQAFHTFRASARSRGFTNIRPLWSPGKPKGAKLTEIIDTSIEPVVVLKGYLVSHEGIWPTPEMLGKLREAGRLSGWMSIDYLRRISNCQALTKKATRSHTTVLPRRPRPGPSNAPPAGSPDHLTASQNGEGLDQPQQGGRGGEAPADPPVEANSKPPGKLEENDISSMDQKEASKQHTNRDKMDVQEENQALSLYSTPGGSVVQGSLVDSYGHQVDLPPGGVPSHSHRDDGVQAVRGEGSSDPARVTPGARGQGGDADRPGRLAILSKPTVKAALVARAKLKLGDAYKGAVLDLRGLDAVLGLQAPDTDYLHAVLGLVRLVRVKNEATVVVDPRDSWTALPGILGHDRDRTYRRVQQRTLEDGRIELLLERRRKMGPRRGVAGVLPQADVVVLGVRCLNVATREYGVSLVIGGGPSRKVVVVPMVANRDTGCLAAVALVLKEHQVGTVAVRLTGPLKGLRWLAEPERLQPGNIDYGDAVRELANRLGGWKVENGWLVGRPSSPAAA